MPTKLFTKQSQQDGIWFWRFQSHWKSRKREGVDAPEIDDAETKTSMLELEKGVP